jgi:molybdate transport system ATP-binding protein
MDAGCVQAAGPLMDMLKRLDLPLAHAADAESIILTTVVSHDRHFGLTRLDFSGGHLLAAGVELPIGAPVRVRILARDVSLTLQRQSDTSILNILPATIRDLADDQAAQVTVVLDLGAGVSVLSRLTRKSVATLGLRIGQPVFAQIKGIALLGPAVRGAGD